MQAAMKEHKARRQARGLEHDALRRELALQAHRLEATSRASLAKGFTRVVENQRALEGEARQFKGAASYLLTQTAQWASQYQAFCADVEVGSTWCVCVGALGFCMPHVHCPRHALCTVLSLSARVPTAWCVSPDKADLSLLVRGIACGFDDGPVIVWCGGLGLSNGSLPASLGREPRVPNGVAEHWPRVEETGSLFL
jgi:hypothetical protein